MAKALLRPEAELDLLAEGILDRVALGRRSVLAALRLERSQFDPAVPSGLSARACELDGPQRCLPSAHLVESPVNAKPQAPSRARGPRSGSLGVVNGVDTAVPCRDRLRATLDGAGVGIAGTRADRNVDSPGAERSHRADRPLSAGLCPHRVDDEPVRPYWSTAPRDRRRSRWPNHVVVGAAEEPAYLPTAQRAAAASELEPVEQRPLRSGRRVGEELNREACDPDRPDLRRSAPAVQRRPARQLRAPDLDVVDPPARQVDARVRMYRKDRRIVLPA